MIILNSLSIRGYRNIEKSMTLSPFSDLNIFIGPNNSGKTTILKCIKKLQQLEFFSEHPLDKREKTIMDEWKTVLPNLEISGIKINVTNEERYNRTANISVVFEFNNQTIENELYKLLGISTDNLIAKRITYRLEQQGNKTPHFYKQDVDYFKDDLVKNEGWYFLQLDAQENSNLVMKKFSVLNFAKLTGSIKNKIVYCGDERLQYYNGVLIQDHLFNKSFDNEQYTNLMIWLQKIIDPKIKYYIPTVKKIRTQSGLNSTLEVSMDELGSGVRSLICLIADVISTPTGSIILIDEPELGLNPSAKHLFIDFLGEQAKEKQIFFATHDPTFSNPILWKNRDVSLNRSIFLFSHINNEFVNVNSTINEDTISSFGGYLPHTTSPKEIHIYVEGKTDVQIFKCFLEKYLWKKNKWLQYEDKISIYHLGGDFWKHLIYTIPQQPYKRIIILDGDKRNVLDRKSPNEPFSLREQIQKTYEDKILFCEEMNIDPNQKLYNSDIVKIYKDGKKTIIYTLTKNKIEDYLSKTPQGKNNGPIVRSRHGIYRYFNRTDCVI